MGILKAYDTGIIHLYIDEITGIHPRYKVPFNDVINNSQLGNNQKIVKESENIF